MGQNPVILPRGLFGRMTRSIGVDMSECQKQDFIHPQTIKRMQKHCGSCAESDLCCRILNKHANDLNEPPDFCPNRKIMLALRAQNNTAETEPPPK